VGEIPAAAEWIHPIWSILLGILLLYGVLRVFGKNPDPAEVGGVARPR
jgi:hypothetical protein